MATKETYTNKPGTSIQIHSITTLANSSVALETAGKDVAWVTGTNTANSTITYQKFWDNASPTVGTTAPNMILPWPATSSKAVEIPTTIEDVFAGNMTTAAVTEPGTGGTTSPPSAFNSSVSTDAT